MANLNSPTVFFLHLDRMLQNTYYMMVVAVAAAAQVPLPQICSKKRIAPGIHKFVSLYLCPSLHA